MKFEPNFDLELAAHRTKAIDTLDPKEFSGAMPQIRLGTRWFSTAQISTWLVPLGFGGALVIIA